MKPINLKKMSVTLIGVALLFSSCKPLTNTAYSVESYKNSIEEYDASSHKITLEQTVQLKKNYDNRFIEKIKEIQTKNIERKEDYEPTEYSWISLEELKRYIKFLEAVEKKNEGNPDISGIAINFGAYNLDKKSNKGDYSGRLNVFFTPTYKSVDKNKTIDHKPFYIHYTGSDSFKGEYKLLSDLYKNENYKEYLRNGNKSKALKNSKMINGLQKNTLNPTVISGNQTLSYNEFNTRPPKKNKDKDKDND